MILQVAVASRHARVEARELGREAPPIGLDDLTNTL